MAGFALCRAILRHLVVCRKPRLKLACRPFADGHLPRTQVAKATGLSQQINDGNCLMAKGDAGETLPLLFQSTGRSLVSSPRNRSLALPSP